MQSLFLFKIFKNMNKEKLLEEAHLKYSNGSIVKLYSGEIKKIKHPFYWSGNQLYNKDGYGLIWNVGGFKPTLIELPEDYNKNEIQYEIC